MQWKQRVRRLRKRREWTVADTASAFGVSSVTIYNWQEQNTQPAPIYRDRMAALESEAKEKGE